MNAGAPCLILAAFLKADVAIAEFSRIALVTAAGLILLLAINTLIVKLRGDDLRTWISPLSFANTGNMGAPICLFAFGEDALALALMVFMITSIFHFSIGLAITGNAHPVKVLIKSPVLYAAILGFALKFSDTHMPVFLFNSIELFGGLAIPLMLFSLGTSLHSLKINGLKNSLFYAVLRLLVGFSIGLLLCQLFALEGILRGIVLIQAAMPSAVFNVLIASNYDRNPDKVAAVVVLSTLLSFLTLPLLLWWIMA